MKLTTKSQLVLASTGIIMGIAYVPATHKRAKPEIMVEYITKARYNPQKWMGDWQRSEDRKKQILANINNIRQQIRAEAQKSLIKEDNLMYKLCTACADNLQQKAIRNEQNMVNQRAAELNTDARYIKVDVLKARKGIITLNLING